MRVFQTIVLLVLVTQFSVVSAQTAGDFRSAQTGDWNQASSWETFNGATWQAATGTPTSASGNITIQSSHVTTIPNGFNVTVDQLTVVGQLVIATGGQMVLSDGTGTDLTATTGSSNVSVAGIFTRGNGSTIDNGLVATRILFTSGSEYQHNYTTTFGDLPLATWNANSTVRVLGFTNVAITADNSWSQSIGHFIYNATAQSALVDFAGNLVDINGNFTILSSGSNAVSLSSSENPIITVDGNFTVSGSSRFLLSTTGTNVVLNIGGNFLFSSVNSTGSSLTFSGNATVNVMGDFVQNGSNGRLHLANAGSSGIGTLNLNGNFSLLAGRLDELGTDPTNGNLRFIGAGTHNFVNNGSIVGYINYYVAPTSTLNVSTYAVVGSPSVFQLEGTLIVGSTDVAGAIQNTTGRGNIRTPVATRTYVSGSTVIYQGAAPQFMNTGNPTGAGVTTVINNASGVSLAANVTLGGALRLQNGIFNFGNFRLTSTGTLENAGGFLGGNSSSSLFIQGTGGGSWGTMAFAPSVNVLGILTLNRTGAGAGVSLNSTLNIASQLNLNNGDFTNTSGLTMTGGSVLTRYGTSNLFGNPPIASGGTYDVVYRTTSPGGGPYANFSTSLELPSDNTSLGTLTINLAQIQDNLNLSQAVTVNGAINFSRGSLVANGFNVTMNGLVWNDNVGNFTAGTGTVIFNDSTQVGGTSTTVFTNIQLNANAYLQFTRSTTVTGNINFQTGSTFDMEQNTLTLSGGVLQDIAGGGNTFSNVTIAKSGGADVQLSSAVVLGGILRFATPSANVNVMSNGFLTVASTTDGTGTGNGLIGGLLSGNTISGNVTVQRYMSPEGKIYRYISSPVTNAMVSQWKDDFLITGPFLDPSPKTRVCDVFSNPASPSLFYYNEGLPGTEDDGYVSYPTSGNATTNSPIVVGRGYAAFIRECTDPTIIDVTGPINQGVITYPVTYTNTASVGDGWNLVGNPYPGSLDWDLGGWTKTRIGTAIAITDNGSGFIRYYDPGVTNDIPNGVIAVGQAFFVRATAASPILRSQENCKTISTAEFFREDTDEIIVPEQVPAFALTFSDGVDYDKAYIKVLEQADPLLDDFDAPKIPNPGPTFSFSSLTRDNASMAINALGGLYDRQQIDLLLNGAPMGSFTIGLDRIANNFTNFRFVLIDHFTQEETNLDNGVHHFEITSDKSSQNAKRFSLAIYERTAGSEEAFNGVTAYPNPVRESLTVEVLDKNVQKIEFVTITGQVFETLEVQGPGLYAVDFTKLSRGVYLMILSGSNDKKRIRLLKE